MPKFLEKALQTEAKKKGMSGREAARYTYGAMNNMGVMHGNKETTKGAKMQAKHDRQEKTGTAEDERKKKRAKDSPFARIFRRSKSR